jgi:predicted nucleotidyltransferase
MAETKPYIVDLVNKLIIEAKKFNINILKVILFGSQANGTANEWSDIDLAVISDDFQGIRFYDNEKIMRAKLNTSCDLEIHPFRPEEFTEENPFVITILKNGIRIF